MESRRIRTAVLAAHLLLVLAVIAASLLDNGAPAGIVRGLALAIPLFLPWRGLLKGHRYTYAWATLCVIPYFVFGIVEAIANPATRIWAAVILALSLALFTGLVLYLRVTRR